MYTVVAFY